MNSFQISFSAVEVALECRQCALPSSGGFFKQDIRLITKFFSSADPLIIEILIQIFQ